MTIKNSRSPLTKYFFFIFLLIHQSSCGQKKQTEDLLKDGWAKNIVNAVIFRKNSLVSNKDTQYISFYNSEGYVVLGKRQLGSFEWILQKTQYQGNTSDAHNAISIMTDGEGYLHIAWDHHGSPLRYARSKAPGSLNLSEKMPMTGSNEGNVSYPEFYKLPDGNLIFLYRDGESGKGNLVINKYNTTTKTWSNLHKNLISGEDIRNAYWQACVDVQGTIHLSWTWRETPDVASNHDIAYACSRDGGKTWEKSNAEKYNLPISYATAEYMQRIPEKSELINQTSMAADENGNPTIATYWRDATTTIPQYHLIYHDKKGWETITLDFRKTPFSLSGAGTKRIPISRPQVLVKGSGDNATVIMVFRDEERGNKPSALIIDKLGEKKWRIMDLSNQSLGSWEPTYDTELWKEKKILNLFVQRAEQADGEGSTDLPPQAVQVLEWKSSF
jgi:hypothetical protein